MALNLSTLHLGIGTISLFFIFAYYRELSIWMLFTFVMLAIMNFMLFLHCKSVEDSLNI